MIERKVSSSCKFLNSVLAYLKKSFYEKRKMKKALLFLVLLLSIGIVDVGNIARANNHDLYLLIEFDRFEGNAQVGYAYKILEARDLRKDSEILCEGSTKEGSKISVYFWLLNRAHLIFDAKVHKNYDYLVATDILELPDKRGFLSIEMRNPDGSRASLDNRAYFNIFISYDKFLVESALKTSLALDIESTELQCNPIKSL